MIQTGIRLKAIKGIDKTESTEFPFNLPLIKKFTRMDFRTPVTFFVGENGAGKSTLIEALAYACDLPVVGSKNLDQDITLETAKGLGKGLQLEWTNKNRKGFFLRAEDFFGFTKSLNQLRATLKEQLATLDAELPDGYGKMLATGSIRGQIKELEQRYGVDLSAQSHGESFLQLFQSRMTPGGLYILDEPETPLSPTRQLSLISIIKQMVAKDCQFIIATHSPILMAYPKAVIYSFDTIPPRQVDYDTLDHVSLTRDFLNNPNAFLDRL